MMTSNILKFVDFTKTLKSRYLENEILFFLQIKKFINYRSRATLWQKNTFVAKVTFKLDYSPFLLKTFLFGLSCFSIISCKPTFLKDFIKKFKIDITMLYKLNSPWK